MKSNFKKSMCAVLAGVMLTSLLLTACGGSDSPAETTKPEETEAAVVLEPVTAADGSAKSLLCKESYTVLPEEAKAAADQVAAQAGKAKLTNELLQALYLMEIAAHVKGNPEAAPDLSLPLDCQVCPLSDKTISWQHYFLEKAVNHWYTSQVLVLKSQEPQPLDDPDYGPNLEWHEKYMAPELPVHTFLYQDEDCYTPNRIHQAYLDQLPELLDTLAQAGGYADLKDMSDALVGKDLAQTWIQAAQSYNTAYMYFTERNYAVSADEEEILTEAMAHSDNDPRISFRHLLVIPDIANVAPDGTVSAPEEEWERALKETKDMMFMWSNDWLTYRNSADNFARIANQKSMDEGTRLDGGLYQNIRPGQLEPVLNDWCFDPQRNVGDREILRSDTGIHVVYLTEKTNAGTLTAEQTVLHQKRADMLQALQEEYPLTVDYSKAALWADTSAAAAFCLEDTLYPDIAHERFPDAFVYLQQDFPKAKYGGGTVAKGGCGITTMAMLASYMTDTIYTPAKLAERYGMYRTESGTNGDMFRIVPAELGFYMQRQAFNYNDILEPLRNNQRVISLQVLGHFTSAGHYLLLERLNDDDTVVVRDSNIFNYEKLTGHIIDAFTETNIMSGNQVFWIMENKITRIPACSRCGDPDNTEMPHKLLQEAYTCEKCSAALSRRNSFVSLFSDPA